MTSESAYQIGLLLAEAIAVGSLVLLFYRLRSRFGMAPLCVTLGAFQHLQTVLAAALYVEVLPGVFVSPGSSVLFTVTLVTTLLVYIRDDAAKAQSLIVGVVAANVTLTLVVSIVDLHVASPLTVITQDLSSQFLDQNLWKLLAGTSLLCLDAILIIVLYEFFYRFLPQSLFLRFALATVTVVSFDTVVFVSVGFYGADNYLVLLSSGLIGKAVVGVLYAAMFTAFLKYVPTSQFDPATDTSSARNIFNILTYRQRYELLQDKLKREPVTGLFNRRFFDDNLPLEVQRAARLGHHLIVMLVDLDNFKEVNDRYGHQVGDQVIAALAAAMQHVFRAADIPCRYGGEEFVVIMPESTTKGAMIVAARLRDVLQQNCREAGLPVAWEQVTFTAGIASYPHDAANADILLRVADERLYEGKRAGRDRVMIGNRPLTESQSVSMP
jgi:diguanylate cyclase (GGDEF)-like protein